MQKIDWSVIGDLELLAFAEGLLSDKQMYSKFIVSGNGGMIRNLLRSKGVGHARELAKRAFNRRKKSRV